MVIVTSQAEHGAGSPAEVTERTLRLIRVIASEMLVDLPQQPREFRLRAGDVCLELEWPEPARPGQSAPPPSANGHKAEVARHDLVALEASVGSASEPEAAGAMVCAPMVGVFYRAPQPGAEPFVTEGDHITRGQQVAIIEAMKLMIPVEADTSGQVTAVLVPDGESVEYGQPLFAVEAGGAGKRG